MDSDVIVIGAGLSGLVAAHELAAAERSVIILDTEPLSSVGGQAYWSLGGLFMVNSLEQRRLRIHDSESWRWPTGWAARHSTAQRITGRDAGPRRT
jgi:predicted oxidoreductase